MKIVAGTKKILIIWMILMLIWRQFYIGKKRPCLNLEILWRIPIRMTNSRAKG